MPGPHNIRMQVEKLTSDLVELSLCNHQNYPSMTETGSGYVEIGIGRNCNRSVSLKNISYREIYDELVRTNSYNLKMIDGALIQMFYRFRHTAIEAHSLSFYSSPYTEEFQNNPENYINDEIYADIIKKSIISFPMRFDFDNQESVVCELEHPMSHLTLGMYENCRIPVSAPLTPYHFISFILRNFYHTAYNNYCSRIKTHNEAFEETIRGQENNVVHVRVPSSLRTGT